jgi:hypothetical protein
MSNTFAQNEEVYAGTVGKDKPINIRMVLSIKEISGNTTFYQGYCLYNKEGYVAYTTYVAGKIDKYTSTFDFTEKDDKGRPTSFFKGKTQRKK